MFYRPKFVFSNFFKFTWAFVYIFCTFLFFYSDLKGKQDQSIFPLIICSRVLSHSSFSLIIFLITSHCKSWVIKWFPIAKKSSFAIIPNLYAGFSSGSAGKESACSAGDPGSIPGSGRSAGEGIGYPPQYSWASLVSELIKNPPVMRETWVWSLGWEDPLELGIG